MRKLLSWLAVVTLVALGGSMGAASASANASYSISGTISDTTATGIGSLSLSLLDSSSALVDTVSTAADGTYSFVGLTDGAYTLSTTGLTGYVAIHAATTISGADVVLNVTDPRYGTVVGVLSSGASPIGGVRVTAVDSVTNTAYAADGPADASGAFSITLPATSGDYLFTFSSSAGARLPVVTYSLGGPTVVAGNICALNPGAASLTGLATGSAITLTVNLGSDPGPCGAPAPASTVPVAPAHHPSTLLAQTGSAPVATAVPTPTIPGATTHSSRSAVSTTAGPVERKQSLSPAVNTAPIPGWGWLLLVVGVLAMLGGVGFTVVRHR